MTAADPLASQAVGSTSGAQTVTVTNPGSVAAAVSSVGASWQ